MEKKAKKKAEKIAKIPAVKSKTKQKRIEKITKILEQSKKPLTVTEIIEAYGEKDLYSRLVRSCLDVLIAQGTVRKVPDSKPTKFTLSSRKEELEEEEEEEEE